MKKLVAIMFLLTTIIAGSAFAAQINVKGKQITYVPPYSFVHVEGSVYAKKFAKFAATIKEFTPVAYFVPEEIFIKANKNQAVAMNAFVILATVNEFATRADITAEEFNDIKKDFLENYPAFDKEKLVSQVASKYFEGNKTVSYSPFAIMTKGADNATSASLITLQASSVPGAGTTTALLLASSLSIVLVKGELLGVLYYKNIETPEDIDTFKDESDKSLASMHFN